MKLELTPEELAILDAAMRNYKATTLHVFSRMKRKDGPEEKDAAEALYEATRALHGRITKAIATA
ncbi:MAG: hypothetical protein J2P48_07625 [Alphaproteobacteria bacterium]|nr:hypothetical protein [Alphaproteobacteria bacterium]